MPTVFLIGENFWFGVRVSGLRSIAQLSGRNKRRILGVAGRGQFAERRCKAAEYAAAVNEGAEQRRCVHT